METARSSETLVSCRNTKRRHNTEGLDFNLCPSPTHVTLKMETARSSETLVSYRNTTRPSQPWRPELEYLSKLHLRHPEVGGSKFHRNVDSIPQHYRCHNIGDLDLNLCLSPTHVTLKMEAASSTETITYRSTTQSHNTDDFDWRVCCMQ
jgi:hypothetical protein